MTKIDDLHNVVRDFMATSELIEDGIIYQISTYVSRKQSGEVIVYEFLIRGADFCNNEASPRSGG